MLDCDHARELIHDALDGMLLDADAQRLDEHLSSCPPCRELRVDLEWVDASLAELRKASILPETVELQPRRLKPTNPVFRTARWAAAVALVVGAGLAIRAGWLRPSEHTPRSQTQPPDAVAEIAASVRLEPGSANRYLPIVKETDQPNIHVVWLHPTVPSRRDDAAAPESDGACGPIESPKMLAQTRRTAHPTASDPKPEAARSPWLGLTEPSLSDEHVLPTQVRAWRISWWQDCESTTPSNTDNIGDGPC